MTEKDPKWGDIGQDVNAQVQAVLREAYLEATELLKVYADKMRVFNEQKKAIREYLNALRKYRTRVILTAREQGIDLCRSEKEGQEILAKLFEENAQAYVIKSAEYEMCIPKRVPENKVNSVTQVDDEIANWEGCLANVSENSELAALNLQEAQQQLTRAIQMISNMSKMAHDSAMAIIQNLR